MTRWWLIGGGAFLGILLIASLILAYTQEEELLPLGTAEAAVQDFLNAAEADNLEVSYGYLSEELKAGCRLEDFVFDSSYRFQWIQESRVILDKTNVVGDITFVDVKISQYYSQGPFGTSESLHSEQFALKQENGLWKFSKYPWPYNFCRSAVPVNVVPKVEPTPAPTHVPLQAPTAEPARKPAAP
jgi:hypothetical protein